MPVMKVSLSLSHKGILKISDIKLCIYIIAVKYIKYILNYIRHRHVYMYVYMCIDTHTYTHV